MLISRRCHCGTIAFTLRWDPAQTAVPAHAYICSFCTRHGGARTACPAGSRIVKTPLIHRGTPSFQRKVHP
jgi:hypothetical protein